jgi:hypothetical protein
MEAYKLGLNPDEFWNMIPSEFFKWHNSKIENLKIHFTHSKRLAGMICCTIANFSGNTKRKYKIEDFIGREKVKQTSKKMYSQVKKLNAMFGGEVK